MLPESRLEVASKAASSRQRGAWIMPDNCLDSCGSIAIIQHSAEGVGPALAAVQRSEINPRQAVSDEQLIELWLHGRSRHTQRAYRADANRFLAFCGKPLHRVVLADLQAFSDSLAATLTLSSANRTLAGVKSLFSFAHRIGYLPFDVARPLRLAPARDGLSERILSEGDVQRMIALDPQPRNRTLLMVLYASGCRVSEISGLRWRDVQPRGEQGQIVVMGKRGKTRSILLPPSVYGLLVGLRGEWGPDAPVFRSRKKKPLSPSQILRIVKSAGRRAGIAANAVVHSFRHSHASHSLERGAPIHLVQATLGHSSVATTGRYLHARPSDSSSTYLSL
jgi:integrase/recombinase XerD